MSMESEEIDGSVLLWFSHTERMGLLRGRISESVWEDGFRYPITANDCLQKVLDIRQARRIGHGRSDCGSI